jgi:uncharacterized protein YjdB
VTNHLSPARRAPAIGLFALTFLVSTSSCESVTFEDPCDSGVGQLAIVITGMETFQTMRVGDTLTLGATVRPITSSNLNTSFGGCDISFGDPVPATISWSSQDTTIVRVSATGRLTARAAGSTDVIARDAARALQSPWYVTVTR